MIQIGLKTLKNQEGNVALWIFFALILFGVLAYSFSKGNRSTGTNLSQYQVNLAATELMDYTRNIRNTVQELRINGCRDEEISFENNTVTGYTNSNSPSDNSCHVFHSNGGGIQLQQILTKYTTSSSNTDWIISGINRVLSTGNDSQAELIIIANNISPTICDSINNVVNLTNETEDITLTKFTGTYETTFTAAKTLGNTATSYAGETQACGNDGSNNNFYYRVLIAR